MSLYKLLGVAKTASKQEIKVAYRKLALQFHPDKHAQLPPQAKAAAAAKFRQISSAYDTLADDRKRAAYDDRNQPLPWDRSDSIMYHSRNTSGPNGGGRGQRGGNCPIQITVALGTFILLIGLSFVDAGPKRERIRKRREKEDARRKERESLKSLS